MLPSRVWRGGTREEYETQHYGFGAQQLSIALRGAIENSIVDSVMEMKCSLISSLGLTDEDRDKLSKSCDKLVSLYLQCAGPAVLRLDDELDKLLEIPDTVVLPEDEEKATHVTNEDLEQLRCDVSAIEKRVQRAALMEALLKVEIEELKSVETHCDSARQTMDTLDNFSKKLLNKTEAVKKLQQETKETHKTIPFVNKKA